MSTLVTETGERCQCGYRLMRFHRKSPFIDGAVVACTNMGDPILMRPKCILAVDPDDELDRAEAAYAQGESSDDDRSEEESECLK